MSDNSQLDLETILPFGEKLLPLLLSSYLTSNDLYQVLKNRGVFLSNSEKESTIPVLRNIILSPEEFDQLRFRQKTKEDRPKTSTINYNIDSDSELVDLVRSDTESINQLVVGQPVGYQIEGAPSLSIKDKNHVFYEYSIIRNDVSKDWANSKSRHEGRVDIEKYGTSLTVTTEYTSDETRDLAKKISKRALDTITKTAGVSTTGTPIKIVFSDFSNMSRIEFLFGILDEAGAYNQEEITDVSFGPDQTKPLPEQAAWMQGKVESLALRGQKLSDIEYFANAKYKDSMLVEAIEAIITFTVDSKNFKAKIRYGFEGFLKTRIEDTEFVLSLVSLMDDKGAIVKSKEISRELQKRINEVKLVKYNEFKSV